MNRELQAEFLKQRTTRTTIGMIGAMLAVALLAIALHAFGLSTSRLHVRSDQLGVFVDVGENLGSLFAALLGAMAITAEVRHGTIRPTLLATPNRARVIVAKAATAFATGFVVGLLATAVVAGAGSAFVAVRGVAIQLGAGDYVLLLVGGAISAALWAVIGLGVGALVRSQVPTMVGILVWVLFVENILLGSVPTIGRYAPGALGRAIAGQTDSTLHTPALGVVLLGLYAAAAVAVGLRATTRRDFA